MDFDNVIISAICISPLVALIALNLTLHSRLEARRRRDIAEFQRKKLEEEEASYLKCKVWVNPNENSAPEQGEVSLDPVRGLSPEQSLPSSSIWPTILKSDEAKISDLKIAADINSNEKQLLEQSNQLATPVHVSSPEQSLTSSDIRSDLTPEDIKALNRRRKAVQAFLRQERDRLDEIERRELQRQGFGKIELDRYRRNVRNAPKLKRVRKTSYRLSENPKPQEIGHDFAQSDLDLTQSPIGRIYRLEYGDFNGEVTNRKIRVIAIEPFGGSDGQPLVQAWCFLRNDTRHFRPDRMLELMDDATGTQIWDPETYFDQHVNLRE